MPVNQSEAPWPALRRATRTVVVVDVVESVRLMEQDEDDTIRRWQSFVGEVVTRLLPQHGGRLVKSLGDGLMLEFESVPPAVQCALAMQQTIQPYNHGRASEQWMCLRIGAHVADVVVDERDIYGSGVNLADRLAKRGGPGEIVVSDSVRNQLIPGLDADIEDLGECHYKHVAEPVRSYRLFPVSQQTHKSLRDRPAPSVRDMLPTLAIVTLNRAVQPGEYGGVGEIVADEIAAAMSRSSDINVVSRLSSVVFSGRNLTPSDARKYLGADFVLSGNCVEISGRLMVYVELVATGSGQVIWAETHVAQLTEILAGQSEFLDQVIHGVSNTIASRAVQRVATQPWPNLHTYELLLAAIALMHRLSGADFRRARELLEILIERAPRQAALYAWMAKWYVLRVQQGSAEDRSVDAQLALDYSRRAIDLDDECSLAYAIDGFVHTNLFKKLDVAEQRYERAVLVNPNDSLAWLLKGTMHAFRGEGELATQSTQRALKLAPLDPARYFYESLAATAALSAGRYAEAVELAQGSLRLNKTHTSTLRALVIAQVQIGDMTAARAGMKALLELEPHLTVRGYLERSPSSGFATGQLWAASLQEAGLPSH